MTTTWILHESTSTDDAWNFSATDWAPSTITMELQALTELSEVEVTALVVDDSENVSSGGGVSFSFMEASDSEDIVIDVTYPENTHFYGLSFSYETSDGDKALRACKIKGCGPNLEEPLFNIIDPV